MECFSASPWIYFILTFTVWQQLSGPLQYWRCKLIIFIYSKGSMCVQGVFGEINTPSALADRININEISAAASENMPCGAPVSWNLSPSWACVALFNLPPVLGSSKFVLLLFLFHNSTKSDILHVQVNLIVNYSPNCIPQTTERKSRSKPSI